MAKNAAGYHPVPLTPGADPSNYELDNQVFRKGHILRKKLILWIAKEVSSPKFSAYDLKALFSGNLKPFETAFLAVLERQLNKESTHVGKML